MQISRVGFVLCLRLPRNTAQYSESPLSIRTFWKIMEFPAARLA